ncbi:hypothetical protein AVEN_256894-1 [Araneus ventricosus]|uniref:Uncharacterized protein n=1 Tax=Araneus ventricosus TaxID=182803 RepID=A0A4Y2CGL7_ARAVE|nr:hypothetical protein AVEN_256894-1 [Araneus ventricosus]
MLARTLLDTPKKFCSSKDEKKFCMVRMLFIISFVIHIPDLVLLPLLQAYEKVILSHRFDNGNDLGTVTGWLGFFLEEEEISNFVKRKEKRLNLNGNYAEK